MDRRTDGPTDRGTREIFLSPAVLFRLSAHLCLLAPFPYRILRLSFPSAWFFFLSSHLAFSMIQSGHDGSERGEMGLSSAMVQNR